MNLDVFQISPLHKFFLALVFNIRFEPDCDLSKEKNGHPHRGQNFNVFSCEAISDRFSKTVDYKCGTWRASNRCASDNVASTHRTAQTSSCSHPMSTHMAFLQCGFSCVLSDVSSWCRFFHILANHTCEFSFASPQHQIWCPQGLCCQRRRWCKMCRPCCAAERRPSCLRDRKKSCCLRRLGWELTPDPDSTGTTDLMLSKLVMPIVVVAAVAAAWSSPETKLRPP